MLEETVRLFVAFTLTEEEEITLLEIQRELQPQLPLVSWIKPAHFHMTMAFLGEVPVDQLGLVKTIVETQAYSQKTLHVESSKLTGFPAADRARAITLQLGGKDSKRLMRLSSQLRQAFQYHQIWSDPKPFIPHITLARTVKPVTVRYLKLTKLPKFALQKLQVVVSQRDTQGLSYQEL